MAKGVTKPETSTTLEEFMRTRAKRDCPVCALSRDVRAQIGKAASERGYTRGDQLTWLHEAVGASHITLEQLGRHITRQHDRGETAV